MGMGKSARVKRGREVASFAKKLMFCDADSAFRCDFIIYYCGGCLIILRKVVFLWKKSNKISELLGEYQTMNKDQRHDAQDISNPQIIISESFK